MTGPTKDGFGQQGSNEEVETLGRYQLVHKLAHGGMASVYLATFSGPGGFKKAVALKRIHPHLAEERAFVEMFLDEARIASRIHHANVCAVNDFGEADGTYYIAMEFLLGEPLSRVLRTLRKKEALRLDRRHPFFSCRVIADACEGLHAAHELRGPNSELLNVVHRDISPQNLFVTYDGNIKIVDFGIASATDRVHHTQGGQIKGKFSYMAPEQAAGSPVDRRADIWSLGVVLWELLTDRRLFQRDNATATLRALLDSEIPAPSRLRPDVPFELDQVVLRALQRNPDARYQTARDFGRDLVRINALAGEPVGTADLAEWTDRLFPDGRTKGMTLMEAVERGDALETIVTDVAMEVSDTELKDVRSAVHARNDGSEIDDDAKTTLTPSHASHPGTPASVPTETPILQEVQPRRRTGLYLGIAAVAFALLIGIGGGAWLASSSGSAAEPTVTSLAGEPNDPPEQADPGGIEQEPEQPMPEEPGEQAPPEEPVAQAPPEEPPPAENPDDPRQEQRIRNARDRTKIRNQQTQAEANNQTSMVTAMEEEPPPQVAPTGNGQVAVFTPGGWANVHGRGGRLLGQTPTVVTLPAGPQVLELRPFGQPPGRRLRVTVVPGETIRLVQSVSQN